MVRFSSSIRRATACLLVVALGATSGIAAAQNLGGRIEAKSLGDRVVIRVLLQTEAFEKETHIVVDYAAPEAFAMPRAVLGSLTFGDGEKTLKVIADGFRLEVPQESITLESGGFIAEFTARHANALGNIDVSAVLGWPVLRAFALTLDLGEDELQLEPAGEIDAQQAEGTATVVVRGVRTVDNHVHVPVSYGDGGTATMTFSTAGYHTYLNQDSASRLDRPAGDIDGISFGVPPVLGLSGMVALFPQPFDERPPGLDGEWLLRSGLGLWSAYRVQINPSAGYLALTPQVDSNYSQADAAFYAAAAADDVDALVAYTERWPEDRNVEEAAGRMFSIGVETDLPDKAQMKAVDIGLSVTPESRKTHYVSNFAFPLFNSERKDERSDLIIALCEEALAYVGRSDRPSLRQNIQLMLGDRYLHVGEAHQAWKTFLSAAFYGDPRLDGVVRHELGRAYEALGRHRRAYSSYQRAAAELTPAPPTMKESAREGLKRLRPLLDPDDPLLKEESPGD
ncbi:MAG: hypothetical protein F4X98_00025 [Gammaproteobacteria bacterium]|nr:hypothetical protein [Gammaproteobacteria bacterium]